MWYIPFTVWTQNYYGQGRMNDLFDIDCDSKEDAIEGLRKHVAYNYPHGRLDFDESDIRFEAYFDEEDWAYDEWEDDDWDYEWEDDDDS